MRNSLLAAAVIAAVCAAPLAAQEHGGAAGRAATITGTVVDVSCLVGSGATGDGHRQCAQVCADGGLPLAILGSDGNVYMPLASAPGQGTNAQLREHAEHRVRVAGRVFERNGVRGIKIESVEMASGR
jgi:type 1 fimbria pilin